MRRTVGAPAAAEEAARPLSLDADLDAYLPEPPLHPGPSRPPTRRGRALLGGVILPKGRYLEDAEIDRLLGAKPAEIQLALTGRYLRPGQALRLLESRPDGSEATAPFGTFAPSLKLSRAELFERLLLHLPAGGGARRALLGLIPMSDRKTMEAVLARAPSARSLVPLQDPAFVRATKDVAAFDATVSRMLPRYVEDRLGRLVFDPTLREQRVGPVQLRELLSFCAANHRLDALRALWSLWNGEGADIVLGAFNDEARPVAESILARPPTPEEVAELQSAPYVDALRQVLNDGDTSRVRTHARACVAGRPLSAVQLAELVASSCRAFSTGEPFELLCSQWDGRGDIELVLSRVDPSAKEGVRVLLETPPPTRSAELTCPDFRPFLSELAGQPRLDLSNAQGMLLLGRRFAPSQLRVLLTLFDPTHRMEMLRALAVRFAPSEALDGGVGEVLAAFRGMACEDDARALLGAVRDARLDPAEVDETAFWTLRASVERARVQDLEDLLRAPLLPKEERPGLFQKMLGASSVRTFSSAQLCDLLATQRWPDDRLYLLKLLAPNRRDDGGEALVLAFIDAKNRDAAARILEDTPPRA